MNDQFHRSKSVFFSLALLGMSIVISGCGGGGGSDASTDSVAATPTPSPTPQPLPPAPVPGPEPIPAPSPSPPPATNTAPTISGVAIPSVNANSAYTFAPNAGDVDGDALTFEIQNKPAWASFNTTTGKLSGTPTLTHAGSFANIVISVSDGKISSALPAFSITVTQPTLNAVTLYWVAPTQNTDGSPVNLAGFTVLYGTSQSALQQSVRINNPGLNTYVLDSLPPGTYYFAVKAFSSDGAESSQSNTVSKVIS